METTAATDAELSEAQIRFRAIATYSNYVVTGLLTPAEGLDYISGLLIAAARHVPFEDV